MDKTMFGPKISRLFIRRTPNLGQVLDSIELIRFNEFSSLFFADDFAAKDLVSRVLRFDQKIENNTA